MVDIASTWSTRVSSHFGRLAHFAEHVFLRVRVMIKCTSFIKGTETKHDSAHRTCKAAIGKGRKIAEHESCSAARALDYQVQVVRFLFNMVKHITTDVGSQVPTTGQFCTLAINHALGASKKHNMTSR